MAETEDELHGDSVKSAGEGKRGVKSRLTSRFNDMNSSYIPKEPLHGLHVDMKVCICAQFITFDIALSFQMM